MTFRAFLFDMDGTLLDNMAVHMQIWVEFLAGKGVKIGVEQFNKFAAGRTNAEILRELVGPHLTEEEIFTLSDQKEELYRAHFRPLMKPAEGLVVFLEKARSGGVAMAVASSAGCENIRFHLQGLGLEGYFSILVGSEDIKNGKPDPEIFLKAAERLGVAPDDCLVFEDTPAGLEAAHRAGMSAIALTATYPQERLASLPAVLRVEPDFCELDPLVLLELKEPYRRQA
jgi:beta-phosphoglucomutase family hydrolase